MTLLGEVLGEVVGLGASEPSFARFGLEALRALAAAGKVRFVSSASAGLGLVRFLLSWSVGAGSERFWFIPERESAWPLLTLVRGGERRNANLFLEGGRKGTLGEPFVLNFPKSAAR